jgi:hypothetical protein
MVTGAARARARARRQQVVRETLHELAEGDGLPDVPLVTSTAPVRAGLVEALQAQLAAQAPPGWTVEQDDGLIAVTPDQGEPALLLEVLPAGTSSRTGASAGRTAPHYWVLDPVWQTLHLLEHHGSGYDEKYRCTDPVLVTEQPFPLTLDLRSPEGRAQEAEPGETAPPS